MEKEDTPATLTSFLIAVGDVLDRVSGLVERGAGLIDAADAAPGITYGWSVRTAAGGHAWEYSTLPGAPRARGNATVHEVFDEGDFVRVVVDVAGADDGDVSFHVRGRVLTVTAHARRGGPAMHVMLPTHVRADEATWSYRNGIFEIRLPKRATADAGATDEELHGTD